MRCTKCGQTIDVTARFCQYCGEPMASMSEGKRPHEVTLGWLKTVLEKNEYSVEETENDPMLIAKHKEKPNFLIHLRPDLGILQLHTFCGGKKPGWGKKTDMFKTINKANALPILGIFNIDEDGNLCVSSHINLTEQLTERDIVGFLDTLGKAVYEVIGSSGLKELMP